MLSIEDEIRDDVKNNYRVEGDHFETGKFHSFNYYDTKRYFQEKKNAEAIAKLLLTQLKSAFKDLTKTTLIGYGSYLGLVLKAVCDSFNAEKEVDTINYAIINNDNQPLFPDNDNAFTFLYTPSLRANCIVVLPITCTFFGYFNIRTYLENYVQKQLKAANGEIKIKNTAFTIFLIKDTLLTNGEVQNIVDNNTKKFYTSYAWQSFSASDRKIIFNKSSSQYTASYLIDLPSTFYLSEDCKHCFVDVEQNEQEMPLLTTLANHDTPSHIFSAPIFTDASDKNPRDLSNSFNDVFRYEDNKDNSHLNGHIEVPPTTYWHFVKIDVFYRRNKNAILKYFNAELERITGSCEEVIIIYPNNIKSCPLLSDLLGESTLKQKNSVTIIPYQPFFEFVENFEFYYKPILQRNNNSIIYFDDSISGGTNFKLISDHLKHARAKAIGLTGPSLDVKGFDAVLTLIDRTTKYSKKEILRKMATWRASSSSVEAATLPVDKFISFYTLNVPLIEDKLHGNSIKQRSNKLKKLLEDCHLDALKLIVDGEIKKGQAKRRDDAENEIDNNSKINYFPFEKSSNQFEYFAFFDLARKQLINLNVYQDIVNELNAATDKQKFNLNKLLSDLTTADKLQGYFAINGITKTAEDKITEKEIISSIVLKILCRPPFILYKAIFQEIFAQNNKDIKELIKKLSIDPKSKEDDFDPSSFDFDSFRSLKFHIKRSVELNSNFIISEFFLSFLKEFKREAALLTYYKEQLALINQAKDLRPGKQAYSDILIINYNYKIDQLKKFRYFLLSKYKELIFLNPARSIKLEKLLRLKNLRPIGSTTEDKHDLEVIIQNPYYQMVRILKIENIHLLNALKEQFKKDLEKKSNNSAYAYKLDHIYENYLNGRRENEKIQDAQNFLKASFYSKDGNLPQEAVSVCQMLKTVAQLTMKTAKEEPNENYNAEQYFNTEIKKILSNACNILKDGDNELNYAFFIEYRDQVKKNDVSNIFTVFSDELSGLTDGKLIELHPNGLVYNMLYGLTDHENGNVQTFIAVARQDDKLLSFNDSYYKCYNAVENNDDREDNLNNTTHHEKKTEPLYEEINVEEALNIDSTHLGGIRMMKNAKMMILFRLAVMFPQKNGTLLKGHAVFAICSEEEATKDKFINFLSPERVRLLLLIKEELLSYLKKQFETDAFIEVMEDRKTLSLQTSMRHGIDRYIRGIRYLLLQSESSVVTSVGNLFCNLLTAHIESTTKINQNIDQESKILCKGADIERMFSLIARSPIVERSVTAEEHFFLNVTDFMCHPVIRRQIIPEIIVNMIRHSYFFDGPRTFVIQKTSNSLEFTNSYQHLYDIDLKKIKMRGGRKMCNNLLESIGLPPLNLVENIENKTVTTILKLINNEKNINN